MDMFVPYYSPTPGKPIPDHGMFVISGTTSEFDPDVFDTIMAAHLVKREGVPYLGYRWRNLYYPGDASGAEVLRLSNEHREAMGKIYAVLMRQMMREFIRVPLDHEDAPEVLHYYRKPLMSFPETMKQALWSGQLHAMINYSGPHGMTMEPHSIMHCLNIDGFRILFNPWRDKVENLQWRYDNLMADVVRAQLRQQAALPEDDDADSRGV